MRKSIFLFLLSSLFLVSNAQNNRLRILYFNDAHELNPVQTEGGLIGGVSRMKTLIDSVRRETPDAVVIFGGDLAGGTLGGKLFRGSVMVHALNTMGVNYANFGQHEFDYGVENAENLVAQSAFKWFTSNIVRTSGNRIAQSHPYILHRMGNKTVGIIGLTDKINTSKPTSGVRQNPIIETAQHVIRQMGQVDCLIAVTQMDMLLNEELLAACPQINLILTEETSQYKTEVQYIGSVPIVAGCGNMGQLADIVFNRQTAAHVAIHPVDVLVAENKTLAEYAQRKTEAAEKKMDQPLSVISADTLLTTADFTGCLVADAYRTYYDTDIAIINGGGIRAKLPAGIATTGNVFAVLPFENIVIPVRLTGYEVKEIIALAAQRMLPQVSGLTYEVKTGTQPEIANVYINNQPIIDQKKYTAALPDYIALGGGNFTAIPPAQWLLPLDSCSVDSDILTEYLRAHPQLSAPDCNRIVKEEE